MEGALRVGFRERISLAAFMVDGFCFDLIQLRTDLCMLQSEGLQNDDT